MTHPSKKHPSKLQPWRATLALPALALCSLPSSILAAGLCDGLSQVECKSLASRNVYALFGSNVIAQVYGSKVLLQSTVRDIDGNLIGIDFRPSQSSPPDRLSSPGLYGLTDTGKIYTLNVSFTGGDVTATLVSSLGTRFDGGFQSLADFNPVVDALRVIGSNDQNYAVVNSNGNLNATAKQTAITYAVGDTQAGQDPNLTAGTYNNNVAGAATTIFYALDYATDSLVTIADVTNGSSATGGGRLKTIGRVVDPQGRPINIQPSAGIDIYTDTTVGNAAIISNGRTLYFLNLATVNSNLPLGSTQTVVAKPLTGSTQIVQLQGPLPGELMDVATTPIPVLTTAVDLAISKTINAGSFTNGQPFRFELTASNNGPDSQAGVTLFSRAFPFKDPVISVSQGSCTLSPANNNSRGFNCNLGTLASGASATVVVTVTRVGDTFSRDSSLDASFVISPPEGFIVVIPNDPDSTNNILNTSVFVNRSN